MCDFSARNVSFRRLFLSKLSIYPFGIRHRIVHNSIASVFNKPWQTACRMLPLYFESSRYSSLDTPTVLYPTLGRSTRSGFVPVRSILPIGRTVLFNLLTLHEHFPNLCVHDARMGLDVLLGDIAGILSGYILVAFFSTALGCAT